MVSGYSVDLIQLVLIWYRCHFWSLHATQGYLYWPKWNHKQVYDISWRLNWIFYWNIYFGKGPTTRYGGGGNNQNQYNIVLVQIYDKLRKQGWQQSPIKSIKAYIIKGRISEKNVEYSTKTWVKFWYNHHKWSWHQNTKTARGHRSLSQFCWSSSSSSNSTTCIDSTIKQRTKQIIWLVHRISIRDDG